MKTKFCILYSMAIERKWSPRNVTLWTLNGVQYYPVAAIIVFMK